MKFISLFLCGTTLLPFTQHQRCHMGVIHLAIGELH
jgi:hypothetical protein